MTLIRGGSAVAIRSYHTDGQGAFSFETDRTADQLLVAKAAGHASSEIALNTTGTVAELNVNFRLRPAGTVMGRVVDEKGNGVGGATIQVRYPGELRRHHFHDEVGDIQADEFKGLPAGRAVVIAHVSGKTPVKQEQVLPEQGAPGSVRVINLIVD